MENLEIAVHSALDPLLYPVHISHIPRYPYLRLLHRKRLCYSEATILATTSVSAIVRLKFVIVIEDSAELAATASPLTEIPFAFELMLAPDCVAVPLREPTESIGCGPTSPVPTIISTPIEGTPFTTTKSKAGPGAMIEGLGGICCECIVPLPLLCRVQVELS